MLTAESSLQPRPWLWTWYSQFPQVTLADLHPEAATSVAKHSEPCLPHRVPFSNGSWNKISVSRKALLSTTAKHSILQNNFQLYSLEYRHLPHQLHQGTVSSAQPALTASQGTDALSHTYSAASGTETLVLLSSSWMGFKTFGFSYKQSCTEKTLPWSI